MNGSVCSTIGFQDIPTNGSLDPKPMREALNVVLCGDRASRVKGCKRR
jgi:hypothetical protein